MANVKKGQTVRPPQWWKHLRDWKKVFWHRQRVADRKMLRNALLLLVGLVGCSTMRSPQLTDYSDVGALNWSNQVLATWSPAGGDMLAYGGAVSAAGLTTGTLLAAGTGSPAVTGLAFGSAMLQWALSIFKPNEHNNALMEGAVMVREAVAKYFTAKTAAGISKTPTDCMTQYAGVLVADVNIAQNRVAFLEQQRMPKDPAPPDTGGQKLVGGVNTCGR